jgi:shikimate dehydrogenase
MSLRFVLLGHPVAHSMSPAIHEAAYRELGLSHRYELLDTPDLAALEAAVAGVRSGAIAGANVTVPWKREALGLADVQAPSAAAVFAANVLCRDAQGRVVAHNTDVPALAEEVATRQPSPLRWVIIGSGGAALGAAQAARTLGAERVTVTARRFRAATPRERWSYMAEFTALGAEVVPFPEAGAGSEFVVACESADVLVQATSAGMQGKDAGDSVADLVPWRSLRTSALAYDVVYNPPDTEFLHRAAARGLVRAHGLGMLVRQAALAIELWLGKKPPFEPLYAAAEAALGARRAP